MKKYNQILIGLLLCLVGPSCSEKWSDESFTGEGGLTLQVKMQEQISVGTRSATSEQQQELEAGCQIKIYSHLGLIRRYEGLANLPEMLHLVVGEYRIAVEAGDSVPSSFTQKFYKGEKEITITKGNYQTETVTCKIQNVLTSITLSDELHQLLEEDYQIKLYTAAGKDTLHFSQENIDEVGYFMPADGITQLGWSFTAHLKGSKELYMQDGIIDDIERTTQYALNFKTIEGEMNDGAAWLELTVDRTSIDIENEVGVYQAPVIWGDGFDLESTLRYGAVTEEPLTVWIATSSALDVATLECSNLPMWGLTSSVINLRSYTDDAYISTGITYAPNSTTNYLKVTLEPALMTQLTTGNGSYTLTFSARGVEDKLTKQVSLQVVVSSLPFATSPLNIEEVFTSRATVRGVILSDLTEIPHFRYRVKGENEWSPINATVSGQTLWAEITGLLSGETYQYQLLVSEESASTIEEFTTEARVQIPNGGFESYHQSGSIFLFYPENGSMWWDSGNHGSATMGKSVTTPDSEVYNTSGVGNTSLKLQSQFVGISIIGKFAAGNLFAGKYLATDGTDGILGFGRPWNSRPTHLVGYVRYQSGVVDYSTLDSFPKGVQDIGSIYIALGDWEPVEERGEMWPVIIKTKTSDRQLFDPNPTTNAGLIAYGEVNYSQATDGMIRFEIPLEYFSNRKPTSLVLVASASKYGDYFTGSSSSIMWVDDLELIYE
ncbi:MAG: DUF4493 domain-containing protein [Phocaeicola sp.]